MPKIALSLVAILDILSFDLTKIAVVGQESVIFKYLEVEPLYRPYFKFIFLSANESFKEFLKFESFF